jgi:hypothetical protein
MRCCRLRELIWGRDPKIRMIRQVEELRAELRIDLFVDLRVLEGREI